MTDKHETERAAAQSNDEKDEGFNAPFPPGTPEEIFEWILHMDLHLTEHDLLHAGKALRSAWPAIRVHMNALAWSAYNQSATEVTDALRWVLPMARGYATEHPVGNNRKIVAQAERILCTVESRSAHD